MENAAAAGGPPGSVEAYIQDMLVELAQLAQSRGDADLAQAIRNAAEEAGRSAAGENAA